MGVERDECSQPRQHVETVPSSSPCCGYCSLQILSSCAYALSRPPLCCAASQGRAPTAIPWIGRSMILSSICHDRLLGTWRRQVGWLYTAQFPLSRDAGGSPRCLAHVVHLVTLALRLCILGFMHSELCPAQLPLTIDAQAPSPPYTKRLVSVALMAALRSDRTTGNPPATSQKADLACYLASATTPA